MLVPIHPYIIGNIYSDIFVDAYYFMINIIKYKFYVYDWGKNTFLDSNLTTHLNRVDSRNFHLLDLESNQRWNKSVNVQPSQSNLCHLSQS